MEELSYVLTQYFVSCVHVRFYFSLHAANFHLAQGPLAFLIVSQPLWIFMFLFLQSSSLLFSIFRSSSFSVILVSVNIKNNVEKDTTLLLFFLFKSPGGHSISFRIKPWVALVLPYLLIELFYNGMPAVPSDGWAGGRSVGRSVYGHVITKFSRMGSLPHFLPMVLDCARFARESSAISTFCTFKWLYLVQYWPISISILILLKF